MSILIRLTFKMSNQKAARGFLIVLEVIGIFFHCVGANLRYETHLGLYVSNV